MIKLTVEIHPNFNAELLEEFDGVYGALVDGITDDNDIKSLVALAVRGVSLSITKDDGESIEIPFDVVIL